MAWFDGIPFKNPQKMAEEQQAFEARVLPFGAAQRQAALGVLRQVLPPKWRDEDMLYAFLAAKDRYLQTGGEDQGLADAQAMLKRLRWIKPHEATLVLALVLLDAAAPGLDAYPTPEQVLQRAEALG